MMFKMCPRCGSRKVKWIIPQNWSQWVCYDCDYTGPIIEGDQDLSDEIHESYLISQNESILLKSLHTNQQYIGNTIFENLSI